MNYDPNLTNSGRMAFQKVRLVFQLWESKIEYEETVGGNCTGLTVIDCAVSNVYEKLPSLTLDVDIPFIVLTNEKGETLECADEERKGEDWLRDMLVKAEIFEIEPDDR